MGHSPRNDNALFWGLAAGILAGWEFFVVAGIAITSFGDGNVPRALVLMSCGVAVSASGLAYLFVWRRGAAKQYAHKTRRYNPRSDYALFCSLAVGSVTYLVVCSCVLVPILACAGVKDLRILGGVSIGSTTIASGIAYYVGWKRGAAKQYAREGRCLKCGYDLTGNESGRCPECGTTA